MQMDVDLYRACDGHCVQLGELKPDHKVETEFAKQDGTGEVEGRVRLRLSTTAPMQFVT